MNERRSRQERPLEIKSQERSESNELLALTRENNAMLRWILVYLQGESRNDDTQDFMHNIIANIVADRIMGGQGYAQGSYGI